MSLTRLWERKRRGNRKLVAMAPNIISASLTECSVHMCKHQAAASETRRSSHIFWCFDLTSEF